MPKGNATFMAQWTRIESNQVVVFKTGLMASGEATENIDEAIKKLEGGEVVYLDPFDQLLGKVIQAWQNIQTQSK